ncbi:MAG: hypothetical protein IJO52_10645, partial [Clostridia bacterium]|nr:hypothetical protein [Clostridia bacterium]
VTAPVTLNTPTLQFETIPIYQMDILDISYDIIGYNEETGYEVSFNLNALKTNIHDQHKNLDTAVVDGYVKTSPDTNRSTAGVYWSFKDVGDGSVVNGSVTVNVPPGDYYFTVPEEIHSVTLERLGYKVNGEIVIQPKD